MHTLVGMGNTALMSYNSLHFTAVHILKVTNIFMGNVSPVSQNFTQTHLKKSDLGEEN